MKFFKLKLSIFGFFLSSILFPLPAGDFLPGWEKAVESVNLQSPVLPERVVEVEKLYNEKGALELTTISNMRVNAQSCSSVSFKLLSVLENNVPLSGKEFEEHAEETTRLKMSDVLGYEQNPFLQTSGNKILSVKKGGAAKTISGRTLQPYSYVQQTAGLTWRGTAWMDTNTSMPVSLSATTPKVIFDKEMTLHNVKVRVDYAGAKRTWKVNKVSYSSAYVYKPAPLMSFKGRVDYRYTFSSLRSCAK